MMDGRRLAMEVRHILFPHDPNRKPLTAVRRMLIHSSIRELQQMGYYERYRDLILPQSLARISELIGPGSMPVELALEHYQACDQLGLSDEQTYTAGLRAGENIGDALMVASKQLGSSTERSAWDMIGAFYRMSRRIYEGGSSQYVKLGPNMLQIENRLNPLFSVRYYRVAYGGFIHRAFSKIGIEVDDFRLSSYRTEHAEIDARIRWKE
jgi:hypothetical protein